MLLGDARTENAYQGGGNKRPTPNGATSLLPLTGPLEGGEMEFGVSPGHPEGAQAGPPPGLPTRG